MNIWCNKGVLRKLCATNWLAAAWSVLFFLVLSDASQAATIVYTATDLEDTTVGEDLWRYSYAVSDVTLAANQGFSIGFDRTLYQSLQSPPPVVNGDWDVLTLQPDLGLSADGLYDALALHSSPSLANAFTLTFVWLGSGVPGAQPYTVYDTDFSTISQGQTSQTPEPSAGVLLVFGLAAFVVRRRRAGSASCLV